MNEVILYQFIQSAINPIVTSLECRTPFLNNRSTVFLKTGLGCILRYNNLMKNPLDLKSQTWYQLDELRKDKTPLILNFLTTKKRVVLLAQMECPRDTM